MTRQRLEVRLASVLALTVALAGGGACAAATRSGAPTPSRSLLLADELRNAAASDAYDAVYRLRPEWLRRRGQISIRDPNAGDVVVYLDGVRYGGPESLRSIAVETIRQMQHLSGGDATTQFGTGHSGGVIMVRTR